MASSAVAHTLEANFDGLVGPTHNYAGLAFGNVASARNAEQPSNPRMAAQQGIAKMPALAELGPAQGVLAPPARPPLPPPLRPVFPDRKHVGSGNGGAVSVGLGGRSVLTKKHDDYYRDINIKTSK